MTEYKLPATKSGWDVTISSSTNAFTGKEIFDGYKFSKNGVEYVSGMPTKDVKEIRDAVAKSTVPDPVKNPLLKKLDSWLKEPPVKETKPAKGPKVVEF